MPRCLIGLGSNVGDRAGTLVRAVERLRSDRSFAVTDVSHWRETSPVGGPAGQGAFLNGALTLETSLPPPELWQRLQQVENELGRTHEVRWGPRTIDLDLLLYGEEQIETPSMLVPHPRMAYRRFVLAPAAEIAGDMRHPRIGWTIDELLANLERRPRYIAIAGVLERDKARLAQELATATSGRLIVDPLPLRTGRNADSTVQTLEPHVKSLMRRRAALDSAAWPPDERLLISDFAWCESLAAAEACLPADAYREFEERWRAETAGIMTPTLTLFLDARPVSNAAQPERRNSTAAARQGGERGERMESAWGRSVCGGHVGPLLRLSGEDFAAALCESQAAVAAMAD